MGLRRFDDSSVDATISCWCDAESALATSASRLHHQRTSNQRCTDTSSQRTHHHRSVSAFSPSVVVYTMQIDFRRSEVCDTDKRFLDVIIVFCQFNNFSESVLCSLAFLIHNWLDYCNGLFAGLPLGRTARLQSVLRAAARFILQLPSRAAVSADNETLHWLSYPQPITFKLCLLTDLQVSPRRGTSIPVNHCLLSLSGCSQLRSAEVHQLFVPRIHTIRLASTALRPQSDTYWLQTDAENLF